MNARHQIQTAKNKSPFSGTFFLKNRSISSFVIQVCLCVGAAVLGYFARYFMTVLLGPGLPPFVTFYPVVVLVFLLVGFWQGVLTTILSSFIALVWVFEPIGAISINSPIEALGLLFFTVTSLMIGIIMRRYQAGKDNLLEQQRLQNWVKTGINELNAKVRGVSALEEMIGDAIAFLSEYLKVGVSVLYLFEERSGILRIVANYAFTRGKGFKDTIRLGEGLVGEAGREKRPLCLNNIPPDYLVIGSALGEAVPRMVLALPLLHDNRLIGVMELGSFNEFSEQELDFLNQSAEVLAITISINQTRQRVNELLQQSRSQEEELRIQQEELQQTNEELEERSQLLEEQRRQIQAKHRDGTGHDDH